MIDAMIGVIEVWFMALAFGVAALTVISVVLYLIEGVLYGRGRRVNGKHTRARRGNRQATRRRVRA